MERSYPILENNKGNKGRFISIPIYTSISHNSGSSHYSILTLKVVVSVLLIYDYNFCFC